MKSKIIGTNGTNSMFSVVFPKGINGEPEFIFKDLHIDADGNFSPEVAI